MNRYLVVVGAQSNKLKELSRSNKKELLTFVTQAVDRYDGIISVIRVKNLDSINFKLAKDTIAKDTIEYLDYHTDQIIEVPGYDVDTKLFRKDAEYDFCGISTSASVLCMAMSLYSCGRRVRVLEEYCYDRMGDKYHTKAIDIMKAYMPGCVI